MYFTFFYRCSLHFKKMVKQLLWLQRGTEANNYLGADLKPNKNLVAIYP